MFWLWMVVGFSLTFAGCYVGAEASYAESHLKEAESGWWAGIGEVMGWIDFIIAVKVSLWVALPAVIGAIVGARWSVRRRKVAMKKARRQKALEAAIAKSLGWHAPTKRRNGNPKSPVLQRPPSSLPRQASVGPVLESREVVPAPHDCGPR